MKNLILRFINKNKLLRKNYEEGYFSRHLINKRIVCFIFQRIFRINSKCKFPVHFTSQVLHPEKITMGRKVWQSFLLSNGCYIQANNGIIIGDDTIFAPSVKIISANHDFKNLNKHMKSCSVIIGKNCWIGSGAIILPKVVLGDNCIIGAGAVVTKSFTANNVIAGNPAKIIRRINE